MKTKQGWPVGLCSWVLKKSIPEVGEIMERLGINHVHLDLRPALGDDGGRRDDYLEAVRAQNWEMASTMIAFPNEDRNTIESARLSTGVVPSDAWRERRDLFTMAVDITAELKVPFLSLHPGYFDSRDAAGYRVFKQRVQNLLDIARDVNIIILLESGQTTADGLRYLLEDISDDNIGVNLDPGNSILYGTGCPTQGVGILAHWIKQVHIKDAIPGTSDIWGKEVPWGAGAVGADNFLAALEKVNFQGVIAIERRNGDNQLAELQRTVDILRG